MAVLVTRDEAEGQLVAACAVIGTIEKQLRAQFSSAEDALRATLKGDRASGIEDGLMQYKNTFDLMLSKQYVRTAFIHALQNIAGSSTVNKPTSLASEDLFIQNLQYYYKNAPRTIKSRGFSYGSVSFSGTGTGTFYYNKKDEFGVDIEATSIETKTIQCTEDEQELGPEKKHYAQFCVYGEPAFDDNFSRIQMKKSNLVSGKFPCIGPTSKVLTNNNLENMAAGSLAVNSFDGITLSAVTGVSVGTTSPYIANYNRTARYLEFTTAAVGTTITFQLPKIYATRPYLMFLAINRNGSSGGVIRCTWGSQTQDITMAAETNWNIHAVDRNEECWKRNFYSAGATVQFKLQALSSGTIKLAFFHFEPMDLVDGIPLLTVTGETPYKAGDAHSYAITCASDSILQRYFAYGFGKTLNHTSGSPDVAEPTLYT